MYERKSGENLPNRAQALIFRVKATLLQIQRAATNLRAGNLKKYSTAGNRLRDKPIIAESKTRLWTEKEPAEQFLLAGKVQNLRIAAAKLDKLEIPAETIFSFWKHVGKTSRAGGFVAGRELREGCIIPNVGGGLCQLSNALYDAALKAGFEIVERHAHTQIVPGSLAEQGRDATVFWNYVDLRFKSARAFRIEAALDAEHLIVRFKGEGHGSNKSFHELKTVSLNAEPSNPPASCATCGEIDCFRAVKPPKESSNFGCAAFLLDEFSPEFDEYVQSSKAPRDKLFIPLDGKRFKKANYAWTTDGFARARQSFSVTARRAYKSRRLAAQGAARQLNLLAMDEKLAAFYAKNLPCDALHLVVQQNLLPYLWRTGVLGGRTFDVLMTAMPLKNLQETLDAAKSLHPESRTLGDFRADDSLIEAETEALKRARKIITAHTKIASLFPKRSELLKWKLPETNANCKSETRNTKPVIVFPASTVGRKGVYELREAMRGLAVKVKILGADVEAENFWEGFDTARGNSGNEWLNDADLVILPAFVEHKPRRLLQAAAAGIPVIASKACGLENVKGIESIESGDAAELREMILKNLSVKEFS